MIPGCPNGTTRHGATRVTPQGELTRRSETSQYPEEEKATAIPLVAASERGPAQTSGACSTGVVGPRHGSTRLDRSGLERPATDGDSPVCDRTTGLIRHLSKTGHVEPRPNLRGPSRKAKYSLATDSEPVARAKGGKNPYQGRIVNLKPHAYKRSEPVWPVPFGGRARGDGVPFA